MANREIQKQFGEMQYPPSSSSSSPIYHNALQDMAYGVWGGNNHHGESVLHYGNNELRIGGIILIRVYHCRSHQIHNNNNPSLVLMKGLL
ncbi:hypothetical protein JHK85_033813 [Glycine max]|nr:hypothetical protein JHK85_033813 [Glycine max]